MATSFDQAISTFNGLHNSLVVDVDAIEADLDQLLADVTANAGTMATTVASIVSDGVPDWANYGGSQGDVLAVLGGPTSPLPMVTETLPVAVSLAALLVPVFEALLGTDQAPVIADLTNLANGTPLGPSLPNPWPPA